MYPMYFIDVVEDICKIGSMAPGAMLFEASKEFQVRLSIFWAFLFLNVANVNFI